MNMHHEKMRDHTSVRFLHITEGDTDQRLDNYLLRTLKGLPKTRIYRIIRKGEVRINKKRATASYRLCQGDLLRIPPVRLPDKNEPPKPGLSLTNKLAASVLYEDSALLILNKPSGVAVHGGSCVSLGVIEALRQIRPEGASLELAHRLDKDTSGCLIVCKKRSALRHIHEGFQSRRIKKTYQALVVGRWPSRKAVVNAPLKKHTLVSGERMVRYDPVEGKASKTTFKVLERFRYNAGLEALSVATLVEASPVTGRTHQIRVHCQHAGYAIFGDPKYGMDADNRNIQSYGLKRLFLHAAELNLVLPNGRPLVVQAPLPQELQGTLDRLKALEGDL